MMALRGGAQFVAHVGQKLRLVLACLGELATLVLYLVEQAYVLDRDRRLVGEGRNELDLFVGEWAHLGAGQCQDADRDPLAQHRNPECGSNADQFPSLRKGVVRVGFDIGNMNDFTLEQGPARRSRCRGRALPANL
jgi:hypothetical protein